MNTKPFTIAVAGKGGTGKTTLATLIIYYLLKVEKTPILAVDADPNVNLYENLGVQSARTVISTMDEVMEKRGDLPAGITKTRYLESQLEEALIESRGFDLLVMGRTEGPGCYCAANNLLRSLLDKLNRSYPYIVMDNEAGMEHLSRRTTRDVDVLFIVAHPTVVSLRTAQRIYATVQELKLNIKKSFLIMNNFNPFSHSISPEEVIGSRGLEFLHTIPYDEEIAQHNVEAKSLLDLNQNSPAVKAVSEMMEKVLSNEAQTYVNDSKHKSVGCSVPE